MARTPYPLEVRRDPEQRVVRISWSDGHEGESAFAHLRGWCPCATCQGHSGQKRYVGGNNDDLERIATVGRYALSFVWGDGHETGIYSYPYLRELCQCAQCATPSPSPA
jgi:DUF971 family protein